MFKEKISISYTGFFCAFLADVSTYPGGKVVLRFKIGGDLHALPLHRAVTEVSLQSVTCQLEVHLLLLTTFRAPDPLPQVRVVEMPRLSLTGARKTKTIPPKQFRYQLQK